MTDRDTAHSRYVNAAIVLATTVSTDARIKADPTMPAERGQRADALRAESFAQILTEYRAAEAAFHAASGE